MDNSHKIRSEILRYLGYKNQEMDSITSRLIDESIEEIAALSKERYTYKFFDILRGKGKLWLKDSKLKLPGDSIAKHLENSQVCVLIAASLGHHVDTRIRYYEKISMTKALILDAAATALIEETCDRVCEEIESELIKDNKALTTRFSPGYGDLPIDIQDDFLSVINARKSIGLSVSSSSILIPRKSVTAVAGVISRDEKQEKSSCSSCSKYSDCRFSKEGFGCGYKEETKGKSIGI